MNCKVFRFTSQALNATAYEEADDRLNEWLEENGGLQIKFITQSSHIRHDTDGAEIVDVVYTVFSE